MVYFEALGNCVNCLEPKIKPLTQFKLVQLPDMHSKTRVFFELEKGTGYKIVKYSFKNRVTGVTKTPVQ